MAVLFFLLRDWQWLLPFIVTAVGLGAVAWFLRSWRAALGVIVMVGLCIAGGVIFKRGYDTRAAEDLAKQKRVYEERIAALEEARKEDEARAATDDAVIAELRKKIADTPPNATVCLDEDAVRRIGEVK